jgi:hypothetical protein
MFNTEGVQYSLTIHRLADGEVDVINRLYIILDHLLTTLTQDLAPTDMVRIELTSPTLDFPISLPFMQKRYLTVERLLDRIVTVLQSFQEFSIDGALIVNLTKVIIPRGSGLRERVTNLHEWSRKNRSTVRITNRDKLCGPRAIITGIAHLLNKEEKDQIAEGDYFINPKGIRKSRPPRNVSDDPLLSKIWGKWNNIRMGRPMQGRLARSLENLAHLSGCGDYGLRELQKIQERVLTPKGIQLKIVGSLNMIVYAGPEEARIVHLFHHDEHFDLITTMPGFISKSYYCDHCNIGYENRREHRCSTICRCCTDTGCPPDSVPSENVHCDECGRYFKNDACFANHVRIPPRGHSICFNVKKCTLGCGRLLDGVRRQNEHVCNEKFCRSCKTYQSPEHRCYMKPIEKKEPTQNEPDEFRYIIFDLETVQDQYIDDTDKRIHEVNCAIVHRVCNDCCNFDIKEVPDCSNCGGQREHIFMGRDAQTKFCEWLLSEENRGCSVFSHNGSAFDNVFIQNYIYSQNIKPEVIMNGAKLMYMYVKELKMRFLDSYLYFSMALKKIPATFDIPDVEKGFWPHFWNKFENHGTAQQGLPALEYYDPDGMRSGDREKFMSWYEEHKNDYFDFDKELIWYCRSDVDILLKAIIKFRAIFMDATCDASEAEREECRVRGDPVPRGIDPFEECFTIASACNIVFRSKFLKPDTLALIPQEGYNPSRNQSIKGLQWLEYVMHRDGIEIRHARNGGEVFLEGRYHVDGYREDLETGQKYVYEFEGDFHHGCPVHYKSTTKNNLNGEYMGDLHRKTLERKAFFESKGYV